MKNQPCHSLKVCKYVIVTAFVLVAAGCATRMIDWNARVASYSYDQAVMEYGPPDKREELKDGTIVAEWLTSRGFTQSYVPPAYYYGYHRHFYGPVFPAVVNSSASDYYLRLIFAPDGKLTAWKKFVR